MLNTLQRIRRTATGYQRDHSQANLQLAFNFFAHGRHFPIRVKRDTYHSVFHPDLIIEDGNGRELSIDLFLVTGHLHNQPNSLVYGSVRDGIFSGTIHSTVPYSKVFYIERANKYFPAEPSIVYLLDQDHMNSSHSLNYNLYHLVRSVHLGASTTPVPQTRTLPFHSIIYSSDHVVDPHHYKRSHLGKFFSIVFHFRGMIMMAIFVLP